MSNIEVEYYSLVTPERHEELNQFLMKNAQDLGEDNKETHFFILKGKIFKVVKNVSTGTAKIVLKIGRIGEGDFFDETEVPINIESYDDAVRIFTNIMDCQIMKSFQQRHNFSYKGVDISIKYSNEWGHHVELEIMVDDLSRKEEADKVIHKVAKELNLKILTIEEAKEFTERIERESRSSI